MSHGGKQKVTTLRYSGDQGRVGLSLLLSYRKGGTVDPIIAQFSEESTEMLE